MSRANRRPFTSGTVPPTAKALICADLKSRSNEYGFESEQLVIDWLIFMIRASVTVKCYAAKHLNLRHIRGLSNEPGYVSLIDVEEGDRGLL